MEELRLGYMVPEFPGQTHTFFWREVQELEKCGINVNIVSTRMPTSGKSPHEWTKRAQSRTIYLSPLSSSLPSLLYFGLTRIVKLAKCLHVILRADDVTLKERAILTATLVYALELAKTASQNRWQHLHSHFCYRAADIVLFASIIAGIPYSISRHGPDLSIGNQNNKWRYASFGTVITSKMLNEIKRLRSKDIVKQIYIISMGVDTEIFKRKLEYQPWRVGDTLAIFCCARIDHGKGQMDLVELAHRLKQQGINFEIRIAGNASKSGEKYVELLKSKIFEYRLERHVLFLGALKEQEVKQQLEEAHLFVLPSKEEPLGVAYMEAMAMEVPTIGNNSGGVPELIEHKHNGLLCRPGSIDDLCEAVDWILQHPEEAYEMGKNARMAVVKKFSSAYNAQLMADALKRASGDGVRR